MKVLVKMLVAVSLFVSSAIAQAEQFTTLQSCQMMQSAVKTFGILKEAGFTEERAKVLVREELVALGRIPTPIIDVLVETSSLPYHKDNIMKAEELSNLAFLTCMKGK